MLFSDNFSCIKTLQFWPSWFFSRRSCIDCLGHHDCTRVIFFYIIFGNLISKTRPQFFYFHFFFIFTRAQVFPSALRAKIFFGKVIINFSSTCDHCSSFSSFSRSTKTCSFVLILRSEPDVVTQIVLDRGVFL